MPHIIIEYPEQAMKGVDIPTVLKAARDAVVDSGLYKLSQIKTRAYAFGVHTYADGTDPYIHIQARICSGRDDDNRNRMSQVILSGVKALELPVSVITVEVVDMDRASYAR